MVQASINHPRRLLFLFQRVLGHSLIHWATGMGLAWHSNCIEHIIYTQVRRLLVAGGQSALVLPIMLWTYGPQRNSKHCCTCYYNRYSFNYHITRSVLNLDLESGMILLRKFGPNPRIIVDILVKPNMEAQYLSDIKSGASSLAYEIPTAFWELRSLQYSSDLIFIRPNVSKWRVIPTLYIPTPFLASTLGIAISGQAAFEQRSFFRMLSGHPTLRSTAEWLFKSYAHAYFSTPNQPPLDGYLRRGRNPHHIPIPTRAVIGSNALKDIQLPFNFYWRSQGPGFSGVDALIRSGDVVWALQFTSTRASCSSGTATEGLDDVFEIMKNEGVVTWHLVIVALDLSSAGVCRDQQKLTGRWKRMRIYACELPLRRFDEDQQEHLQAMLDEVIYFLLMYSYILTLGQANETYPVDQRAGSEVQIAEL